MSETSEEMTEVGLPPSRLEARPLPGPEDFLGKRRMAAVIDHLNQEIRSLEEEIQELDAMDTSSSTCKEVLQTVDSIPDGLLPLTKGPTNADWNRWFQGGHSSSQKRWIQKQFHLS